MLLGHERHRRAGHDVGDRRELLGRRLGGGDEPGDRVRASRAGSSIPPTIVGDLVQPELEPGRDAEVAAAAADRPEQVRVRARRRRGAARRRRSRSRRRAGCRSSGRTCGRGSRSPPPSVIPPIPTEPVSPKPVARPCSPTAVEYSAAVRPVSAQAVRPSTSMSSAFMSRRSRTMPPSVVLWPAPLWPPLRTASSRPVSRASAIDAATSSASATRTMTAGRSVDAADEHGPRRVVVGVPRADDPSGEVSPDVGDGDLGGRAGNVHEASSWRFGAGARCVGDC